MHNRRYTDGEALEIADDIAEAILKDYRGLVLGDSRCEVANGQLEDRISRTFMAFHRGDAHLEGTRSGTRPRAPAQSGDGDVKLSTETNHTIQLAVMGLLCCSVCWLQNCAISVVSKDRDAIRAKLAIWECTAQREPEQPPAPIAVDEPTLLEEIPQLELDEAVPPLGVVGAARSGKWPSVRAEYLRLHPTCEACGTDKELNVHHVHPFHEHPELELQMSNLITLCREHHLTLGHDPDGPDGPMPRNWSASNPHVRRDAAKMLSKTTVAP